MPKLSEAFLHVLGNQLQNGTAGTDGITQASQMPTSSDSSATPASSAPSSPSGSSGGLSGLVGDFLEGIKQMSPIGIAESVRRGRQSHDARLAIAQAENARANIDTQKGLSSFAQMAPGTAGPDAPGTFQFSPNDASLAGLVPGTKYAPRPQISTDRIITPGKTPGSSNVSYSSRTLSPGETMGSTINTLSPYAALTGHQLGFQKDLFDKYDSDMHTNQTALANVASRLPKGIGQSLVDSITSGAGIPAEFTQSPEYQANSALIQKFSQQYAEAKKNRDAVLAGTAQGGGGQPTGGGNTATRPAPPAGLANPPLGHIAVWNKSTNSYGFIPQANFNPALHEQVGQQTAQ